MPRRASDDPLFMLVDDQIHSARLLVKTLRRTGCSARVRWLGDARRGGRLIAHWLAARSPARPDMVIVDLKAYTGATADFIAPLAAAAHAQGIPIAAITASLEHRDVLLSAGADGVFERHPDLDAYRREMAHLMEFWVRAKRALDIRA